MIFGKIFTFFCIIMQIDRESLRLKIYIRIDRLAALHHHFFLSEAKRADNEVAPRSGKTVHMDETIVI